jgi:transposase InsO family protein
MAAGCPILDAAQAAITLNGASFPTCYGLVFTSRSSTALISSYGLKQELITPHCTQQNGMVERVIWRLKDPSNHRQRFDSIQHETWPIGAWNCFYNPCRAHQALDIKTLANSFALAPKPCRFRWVASAHFSVIALTPAFNCSREKPA